MADTSLPRETGTEAPKIECQNCGATLTAKQMDDGALAYDCPTCWPAPAPEKADAKAPARQKGTDVENKEG